MAEYAALNSRCIPLMLDGDFENGVNQIEYEIHAPVFG
jgi:hypothetical protein